jgi:DNA invertase Pin-like site-specific DNA recombinase
MSGLSAVRYRYRLLARSTGDLQDIVRAVKSRGASLRATEQPIDTSTAAGKCFLDMLGVFAEFETNLRRERQLKGIADCEGARRLQGAQGEHRSGQGQADESRWHGAVRHREGA